MERVLFVCGLIPDDREITLNTINFMNAAADAFQKMFIEGFEANNVTPIILSAPFVGAYPVGYKKFYFKGKEYQDSVKYVSFINLWGLRNCSRYLNLKKEIKKHNLHEIDRVIIYSVHTPFANVARYIKRKNPNCEICLIVPDLPEYMNLRKNKTLIYKVAKKIDCKLFYQKVKYFDCFSLVTKNQSEKVNLYNKKEIVIESIAKNVATEFKSTGNTVKKIVYTGSLNEQFGVLRLLSAVLDSDIDAQLVFCGSGDSVGIIADAARKDNRIIYKGVVDHREIIEIQRQADVLVNPRLNEGEYTKYSFPGKTLEYLSTGRPVVCYKLDGIPDEYDAYLNYPENNSVESLTQTLKNILALDEQTCQEIFRKNTQFLLKNKNDRVVTKKLLDMFS